MTTLNDSLPKSPLHKSSLHESGYRHANGGAKYIDDLETPRGSLLGHVIASPHAHARILRRDATRALEIPGVHAVIFADDIPGHNEIGAVIEDEPLLAKDEVHCVGQAVGVVFAESYEACRAAAAAVEVDYEALPAIVTLREAVSAGSFLSPPHVIQRGDVDAALSGAAFQLKGEVTNGWQDHFYLETHASLVLPEENNTYRIYSSSQHPSEVQAKVAEILGIGRHEIVVEVPRMGGGFGGKETQAANFAALAALGVWRTGRPVKQGSATHFIRSTRLALTRRDTSSR